jgi:hypothetical protein
MGTTDVCIRTDIHDELLGIRDRMGMKSFSDLFRLMIDNFIGAPPGVPAETFKEKMAKYQGLYPDAFKKATTMCIGIDDPEEFDAAFEEIISDMIKDEVTSEGEPEEVIILQCAKCHHVWDYRGKKTKETIGQIHCPSCQATASKKWLRKLIPYSEAVPDAHE